jgi:protein SCO1/2
VTAPTAREVENGSLGPVGEGPAAPAPQPGGPRRRRSSARELQLLALLGILIVALVVVAVTGSGGAAKGPKLPAGATATTTPQFMGQTVSPPTPAPPISLRNYLGRPVSLNQYSGKAVLVTFLYVHCPDVCPLITAKLHEALMMMPAVERRQVEIVAVSVDPRGDTPAAVGAFLKAHGMTGRMEYLGGSAATLAPVWREWNIGAVRDGSKVFVTHTALVYGISATGEVVTIYFSNFFTPQEIVHDVRRLATL